MCTHPHFATARVAAAIVSAIALMLPLGAAVAADSLSDRVNARAQAYEQGLVKPFEAVLPQLEKWLDQQRQGALGGMRALMGSAKDSDKLFVAYHVLRVDPKDQAARAAFAEAKAEVPFDDKGTETGSFTVAKAVDPDLVEHVAGLEYPAFEIVRDIVAVKSPLVASYWDAQGEALKALKTDMLTLKDEGQPDLVFQQLAYYYPDAREVGKWYKSKAKSVPRQRWWIDHVDQYLLDHELAGLDGLTVKPKSGALPTKAATGGGSIVAAASWSFPTVRNCRFETVFSTTGLNLPSFTISDDVGGGVMVIATSKQDVQAMSLPLHKVLGKAALAADFTAASVPLEVEVRDKRLIISVGGLPAIATDLPTGFAFSKLSVEGRGMRARALRVRFLGAARADAAAVAVAKPPEWPAERRKELEKPVTVSFNDTAVDEAITLLSRLSGVKITLDESGALLKDLPVTLVAKDMSLGSTLQCLERQSDLHATPTADGIVLSWKK